MISIAAVNPHEVIAFAQQELLKYLQRMLGPGQVMQADADKGSVLAGRGLRLGLIADFPELTAPEVENPAYDDAIAIRFHGGAGLIAGVNPRSVLLAVYRFLTEAGCHWVRPGADGEIIPSVEIGDFAVLSVDLTEKASYRHRGVCIEGALSYENLIDFIDWLPKLGMNSYFIQFREAFAFFERWYAHLNNPYKAPAPFAVEMARDFVRHAEKEIKRRGLIYHAVGHGWTCEPFGLPALGWEQRVTEAPAESVRYLAEVNGKRGIWQGIPLNTNLCYSNPEVRRIIVSDIIKYIKQNGNVDLLHFWLADGCNNHCECPGCREATPSDFYVRMLNELDAALTAEGLATRVVFLIYYDLLWPPERERLLNTDRFVLMFAPITRSYTETFDTTGSDQPIPAYVRNRLTFPASIGENLAFLRAWQRIFSGDSFDFDYHLMWAHYFDPGGRRLAETAHEDVKNLRRIGLNGFISCQVHRAFLPSGLPLTAMARTLWNGRISFETIAGDYFDSAFGLDGRRCLEFLGKLPILVDRLSVWAETPLREGMAERIREIPAMIRDFMPVAEANCGLENHTHARSWQYLRFHLEITARLSRVFLARAAGDGETVRRIWEELKQFIRLREDENQAVFDVYLFIQTMEGMNGKMLNL